MTHRPMLSATFAAILFASVAQGQQNPGQNPANPNGAGTPGASIPGGLLQQPGALNQGGQQPDGFSSIWTRAVAPEFEGFPVFPSRLSGYGAYPLPVDPDTGAVDPVALREQADQNGGVFDPSNPLAALGLLAPAGPVTPGWPAWVRTRAKKPLPFAVDVGLLIEQGNRVWFRQTADEPFVPLMFHDKFATLPVGGEVQVRQVGLFELLLHMSTRIETRGRTHLRMVAADEERVEVELEDLTWMRVQVNGRTNVLRLPDGSRIEVGPPPAPAAGLVAALGLPSLEQGPQPAYFEIRRDDEPGWYGGRATISNLGGREITYEHAFGKCVLQPSHQVTFFLSPPTVEVRAGLDAGNARVEQDGERVRCVSAGDNRIEWCGARIQVPAGADVTLESLGGEFRQQPALSTGSGVRTGKADG